MGEMVSIIIPVYNVEKYLRKCVQSVINQDYANLDIVLVDDGSKDSSGEMCDEFASTDNRIRVVHKTNGGLSSARNVGLEYAKADYVTFIDSDDWVANNYISEMKNLQEKYGADIVQCNRWFEDGVINETESVLVWNKKEAVSALFGEYYIPTVNATCKLIKKDLFNDLRFVDGMIHEDEMIAHRLLMKVEKMVFIDKAMYCVFRNPNSITRKTYSLSRHDALTALEDRLKFFETQEEKEFFSKTLFTYFKMLKKHIDLTKKHFPDEQLKIKILKKKLRKTVFLIIKDKNLKLKLKLYTLLKFVGVL